MDVVGEYADDTDHDQDGDEHKEYVGTRLDEAVVLFAILRTKIKHLNLNDLLFVSSCQKTLFHSFTSPPKCLNEIKQKRENKF